MKYEPGRRVRSVGRRVFSLLCIFLFLPAFAAALPETLVPLGVAAGIRLPGSGVVVAGLTGIETDNGVIFPARDAGIQPGDVLVSVNDEAITSPTVLQEAAKHGRPLTLTVQRETERLEFTLTPVQGRDGFRIGVWLRDSMLGIGTLTYYSPDDASFGALGHGITHLQSDQLISLDGSAIIASYITDVQPGKAGEPGALHGSFEQSRVFGTVEKNTHGGIFGRMHTLPTDAKPVPCAPASEVHVGEAQILTCPDGETPVLCDVRILKLYPNDENLRNLLIEVTDEALLEKTGGIVQGMSGSPILQDGCIIGAVTHVLVNDPARGYGIFIENMLAQAG